MTVQMDCDEGEMFLQVEGDIYDEHAQCLRDMVNCQVCRGLKKVNIEICSTCYVSQNGQSCFKKMTEILSRKGIQVSFISPCATINCAHHVVMK